MMISPELYYETELKESSADQIMSCIRGLKKEIGHCKKVLEDPYKYVADMGIHPSSDTVLSVTRDYLERAKIALADAGGVYTPSAKEKLVFCFMERSLYFRSLRCTFDDIRSPRFFSLINSRFY